MWNDTELQRDVESELAWELRAGLKQISVAVKGGAVELAGHVDTYWERCAAETAAWRVNHVNRVTNHIRVDLPFPSQRADDDIALAAMGILEWNGLVPDTVQVQVANAKVTLSGSVERQQQRDEAERVLRALIGITELRNEVVIQPNGGALAENKSPIEAALKRNSLADSNHIKVHVAHGVVTLRGAVRSRPEYEEALQCAWAAPGVVKIDDHIQVGVAKGD
jgi:osmotically-inducible protein OsmY